MGRCPTHRVLDGSARDARRRAAAFFGGTGPRVALATVERARCVGVEAQPGRNVSGGRRRMVATGGGREGWTGGGSDDCSPSFVSLSLEERRRKGACDWQWITGPARDISVTLSGKSKLRQ